MFVLLGPDHLTRTSGPDWQLSFHDPLGNSHTRMPWSIWFVCVFHYLFWRPRHSSNEKNNACYMCIHAFQSTKFHQYSPDSWYFFDSLGNSPPSSPSPGKSVNLGWVGECIMCCIQWGHDPYRKKKGLTSPPQQDRIISNKGLWFAYGLIDMY